MEKEFSLFRKSTFGGFNRKDVINYIEKLRNESFEYRKQVEETVNALNEKIIELENASNNVANNGDSAEVTVSQNSVSFADSYNGDISQATKHLKTVADELCRSLGDFIEKLSNKGIIEEDYNVIENEETFDNVFSYGESDNDFVGGILSSFSFICDAEIMQGTDKNTGEEKIEKNNIVSDILSGLSFLD